MLGKQQQGRLLRYSHSVVCHKVAELNLVRLMAPILDAQNRGIGWNHCLLMLAIPIVKLSCTLSNKVREILPPAFLPEESITGFYHI